MTPGGINETAYRLYNAAYVAARAAGRDDEDAHEDAMYVVRQMQAAVGVGGDPRTSQAGVEALREVLPSTPATSSGVVQQAEQRPFKSQDAGSTPAPTTTPALVAQMAERPARNGMVAGSMPAEGHIQAEADATRSDAATSTDTGTGTSSVVRGSPRVCASTPVPVSPRVAGPSEWGYRGHLAQVAKHGERRVAAWLRKGGRPKDPSYIEIMAATTGNRAKALPKRGG